MPFGFGRKKDREASATPGPSAPRSAAPGPVPSGSVVRGPAPSDPLGPAPDQTTRLNGFTEEWRLQGELDVEGRLLEILNMREAIPVRNVSWAPLDGSAPFEPAPGIKSIDPYDLIVAMVGADVLTARTEAERAAHRVHKVTFDVALELPPFRIVGSVQLYPGIAPESLLERGTQMFAAVTRPTVRMGDAAIDLGGAEAVLVNRYYLRGVIQVDTATGQPFQGLPGA